MSKITNRGMTPEEDRRQALRVAIEQEAPESLLNLLSDIVEHEDWKRFRLSFLQYIELPYDQGGVGWSQQNLKAIVSFEHRRETKRFYDEYQAKRVQNMRKFVGREIAEEIPAASRIGDNQHTEGIIYKNQKPVQQGTSRDYIIAQLKRDHPDLAQAVIDDKFSAQEGKRLAYEREHGYKPIKVTFTDLNELPMVVKKLKFYLSDEQIAELIALLIEGKG